MLKVAGHPEDGSARRECRVTRAVQGKQAGAGVERPGRFAHVCIMRELDIDEAPLPVHRQHAVLHTGCPVQHHEVGLIPRDDGTGGGRPLRSVRLIPWGEDAFRFLL